jgi:hypothetical protein
MQNYPIPSHLSLLSWRMHLPNLKPAHLSFASFPYCAITSKVEAVINTPKLILMPIHFLLATPLMISLKNMTTISLPFYLAKTSH